LAHSWNNLAKEQSSYQQKIGKEELQKEDIKGCGVHLEKLIPGTHLE